MRLFFLGVCFHVTHNELRERGAARSLRPRLHGSGQFFARTKTCTARLHGSEQIFARTKTCTARWNRASCPDSCKRGLIRYGWLHFWRNIKSEQTGVTLQNNIFQHFANNYVLLKLQCHIFVFLVIPDRIFNLETNWNCILLWLVNNGVFSTRSSLINWYLTKSCIPWIIPYASWKQEQLITPFSDWNRTYLRKKEKL